MSSRKPPTVADLIEALSKYPPDAPVYAEGDRWPFGTLGVGTLDDLDPVLYGDELYTSRNDPGEGWPR